MIFIQERENQEIDRSVFLYTVREMKNYNKKKKDLTKITKIKNHNFK